MPMRCSDRIIQRGTARLGIRVIHVRKAALTKPRNERPACQYCGNCMAGCDVVAKYDSANVQMFPAQSTGKLTILSDSVVREVTLEDRAHVNAVRYLNRQTLKEGRIQTKSVVVSCACIQSVALLLMSRSEHYPCGLGSFSGQLGKHYIPHFTGHLTEFMRKLIGSKGVNEEGTLDHAYIPSYMHPQQRSFARSFGVQFNYQNRRLAPWARQMEGLGSRLKKGIRERYPAYLQFSPYGEMLPEAESTIDLDWAQKDRFGLAKARVDVRYGENERKLFASMRSESRRILEASGIEILDDQAEPRTNHELGGCRMGNDPAQSVVNPFCQSHDVPNLFVVDGSVFPSASEKNPTLTIMALAARTADHIAEQFRNGKLG
ncbi:MAG: GMC family oxidoreductase [Acidobacteria bacterium]|nr:GMC family oxidoreductase [Acidobacteriota bacterium]